MAPPLLKTMGMAEPIETDEHVERRVVYETRSSSSTKASAVTFVVILTVAVALITWVIMQMG